MHTAERKISVYKGYILYDSNCMIPVSFQYDILEKANYRYSRKISGFQGVE